MAHTLLFSQETWYQIQIFWGVLNVIVGLLGLYFVYRWGVTLIATDDKTRRILMGEPFYTWFSDDDVILAFAAGYLGFKLLYIVFSTARWEMEMEKTRRDLFSARRTRKDANVQKRRVIEATVQPAWQGQFVS